MVLGNFKTDAATQTVVINPTYLPSLGTDIYIDDVSLVEMELPAFAGRDTFMIPGDSIFIGREPDVGIDYACHWYKLPDDTVPFDTIAGLWVKPTETTSYLVRQQLWCSGVKWDTVTVTISGVGLTKYEVGSTKYEVDVWPNPADDKVTIRLSGVGESKTSAVCTVLDQLGRTVLQKKMVFNEGSEELDTSELQEGMYFITLKNEGGLAARKRIFIMR
jgi:hypothetical protein